MRRRTFLASTTVSACLAGCMGLVSDSPTDVVDQWITRLYEGNVEAANDLLHEDAPREPVPTKNADVLAEREKTMELTLEEKTEESAIVTVDLTYTVPSIDDVSERSDTVRVELRPEDGSWRIWDWSSERGGRQTPADEAT